MLVAAVALNLLLVSPAQAHALKKAHWYSCYDDFSTYIKWIDINANNTYETNTTSGTRGGKYRHVDGKKIRWTSGPLKGYASRHLGWRDGADTIKFSFPTRNTVWHWTCYNDLEL